MDREELESAMARFWNSGEVTGDGHYTRKWDGNANARMGEILAAFDVMRQNEQDALAVEAELQLDKVDLEARIKLADAMAEAIEEFKEDEEDEDLLRVGECRVGLPDCPNEKTGLGTKCSRREICKAVVAFRK